MTTDADSFVTLLAERLGEKKPQPIAQLHRIVERCGIPQTTTWLEETEQVEANGGEMLSEQRRRRTRGGVFFRIVRQAVTGEDRRYIFPKMSSGKGPSAPTPPPLPAANWTDREALVGEAQQQSGKATTVKMTVIGKVGKAIERQGFTLLTLEHDGKLPALPKGIPTPTQPLPTSYILYIGSKQWNKVKDSLKNTEDVLIAEGVPVLDPKYQAITVFVTNTTKLLQQAQRQGQQTMQTEG